MGGLVRLIDFFDKGAEIDPGRAFLIDDLETRSFRDVQAMSHRIANALGAAGISIGAKAAVLSPNTARAFECVIGILRFGAVWIPVSSRNTAQDNAYILDHADTEVLFFHSSLTELVRQFRGQCPRMIHLICIDQANDLAPSLAEWTAGQAEQSADKDVVPTEMATMMYTGGTTGRPKGVMLSHAAWESTVVRWIMNVGCEHPVHLVVAPMTHAAGLIALALMPLGTTNVLLPSFDAQRVMTTIQRHRVTHLFLPPTAIYMMLAHSDVGRYDYSSLRHFVFAAAPMSLERLKEAISIFGPVMTTAFGQSEAMPNLTYMSPRELVSVAHVDQKRLGSCGRVNLQVRLEVLDEEGNILPPNTRGEICVKGSARMIGYYKDAEATAEVSRFGWHHTGDVGYKDEHGYLYIVDRKKDMIISGGFNIYPAEIEQVLWGHPAVGDCAVIGVPDEKWGEAVKAIIEAKPGGEVDIAELEARCREHLSGYKVPKSFEVWPALPRSPVGKVLKRAIRERYWQERQLKV